MLAQENDYLNRAYEKLQEISADEQKRQKYDAREKTSVILNGRYIKTGKQDS